MSPILITGLIMFTIGALPLCYAYGMYLRRQYNLKKANKHWEELQRRMDEDTDHEDAQY